MSGFSNYIQSDRLLSVSTMLGNDELLLDALTDTEEVNAPFRFEARVRAKNCIRIRGLRIAIESNKTNFAQSAPGEGASCLQDIGSTPFVRM